MIKLHPALATALVLFSCTTSNYAAESRGKAVVKNRAPLQQNVFNPLPLGAIRPAGWLRRQLEIQASGLTGHLDEFWNDVGPNSGWLGGTGESWERGPYYLDGLLPLAYLLDDQKLKAKANQWVEWTLTHQLPDGQIGPPSNNDWWPRMVMLKVLTQYQEATGDDRVIPLMSKYFAYELRELPNRPLRDWGKYRWQDNVYSVLWLYNRTGERSLLSLAKLLHDEGYDWERQFAQFEYTDKQTKEGLGLLPHHTPKDAAMQTHGVNNAMALKVAPVWWLLSGKQGDRAALSRQLNLLDYYHGLPNGMFSGDEHLAGRDPSQGIELCAVVESMFSYEQDFAILGVAALADRLEKVTYNALPATLSNDMWSHQYDQQPNQIACTRAHRQWSTNGNDSNLFGLEPNFGCCTANLHQGWPKFVSSLWMATSDGGLVTAAYAPNEVHTEAGGHDISIVEETDYPFRGDVTLRVHPEQPASFSIVIRMPRWSDSATVTLNGQPFKTLSRKEARTGFYSIRRTWSDDDVVRISFPMNPRVTHWYKKSAVFERGPLVFSLPLGEQWQELKTHTQKSADWQVTPKDPWNYAVELGACEAKATELAVGGTPFDVQNPPVSLAITARRFSAWTENENSAGPLPLSPVTSSAGTEILHLVPYGAAKLRVTAFPYLKGKSGCESTAADRSPVPQRPSGE